MKTSRIFAFLALLALTQIIGCASIVNGQNQSVSVEARSTTGLIVGASCQLTNNKGTWFVVTPGSTMVQRSFEDMSVQCEKELYDPSLLAIKSATKGMVAGNILFGGLIGLGVDVATGAAYDYPPLISVAMTAQPVKSKAAGPVALVVQAATLPAPASSAPEPK